MARRSSKPPDSREFEAGPNPRGHRHPGRVGTSPLRPPPRRAHRSRAVEPGARRAHRPDHHHRPRPLPLLLADRDRHRPRPGDTAGDDPCAHARDHPQRPAGAHYAAHGSASSGGRRGAPARVRASRPGGVAPLSMVRAPDPVHHRRGRDGRDICRHALSRHRGRGRPALARPPLRGSGSLARSRLLARLHARHASAPAPGHLLRRSAVLGARPRRVRRHDHVRRQLSRADADGDRWLGAL